MTTFTYQELGLMAAIVQELRSAYVDSYLSYISTTIRFLEYWEMCRQRDDWCNCRRWRQQQQQHYLFKGIEEGEMGLLYILSITVMSTSWTINSRILTFQRVLVGGKSIRCMHLSSVSWTY